MNENESQQPGGEKFQARELTPADFGVTPVGAPTEQESAPIGPELDQNGLEDDPSEQGRVDRIREAILRRRDSIMASAVLASSSAITTYINVSTAENSPMWTKAMLGALSTISWVGAVKNSFEAKSQKDEIEKLNETMHGADHE